MSEMATLNLGGDDFFGKCFEEHLKERKIIINNEISSDVIEEVILQIMKFNKEDKGIEIGERKPIYLYLNSVGGDVLTGLTTIDVIKNSRTPIIGVVLGYAYSMGCLLFVSCHKRYMLPSSSLLIHDGSTSLSGSNNKVKDLQKFYSKLDERVKNVIVNNSNINSDEYDVNIDRELYILADECKDKGLCDAIVGVDIDLDEII